MMNKAAKITITEPDAVASTGNFFLGQPPRSYPVPIAFSCFKPSLGLREHEEKWLLPDEPGLDRVDGTDQEGSPTQLKVLEFYRSGKIFYEGWKKRCQLSLR